MYIIIGGDGKEYGPIAEADVRQWVAEGRLNAQSPAKAESDAEFRPLEKFPEFAALLGAGQPPPLPGAAVPSVAELLERDYELNFGDCFSRGFQLFKDHFGLLLATMLIVGAVELGVTLASVIPLIGMLFSLGNLFIAGPLMGGLWWVFLCAARGQPPAGAGEVFCGFRKNLIQLFLGRLVPSLIAGLCIIPLVLVMVAFLLPALAHQQHGQTQPDPRIFLILIPVFLIGFILMLYLQACWMFTLPLIIDRNMDFWPAMRVSWKKVNQHRWKVLGLVVLAGLLNLLGMMLCLVGALFTAPIALGAMVYAYETIFSGRKD